MNSAFEDGQVSDEEYQNILQYMQSYNDAMTQAANEAQSEADYVNQQMLLHKAQTASLEEIQQLASDITNERDSLLAKADEEHQKQMYGLEYRYKQAIENGWDLNGDGQSETEESMQASLAQAEAAYQKHISEQSAKYDDILMALYDSQLRQSEMSGAYGDLETLAAQVIGGTLPAEDAVSRFTQEYGGFLGDKGYLDDLLQERVNIFGGYEGLEKKIDEYRDSGDIERMNQLLSLYTMGQIASNFGTSLFEDQQYNASVNAAARGIDRSETTQPQTSSALDFIEAHGAAYDANTARETINTFDVGRGDLRSFFNSIGLYGSGASVEEVSADLFNKDVQVETSAIDQIVRRLGETYDLEGVLRDSQYTENVPEEDRGSYAAWELLYGSASQREAEYKIEQPEVPDMDPVTIKAQPVVDESSLPSMDPQPLPIEPYVQGTDAKEALEDQGVDVQVDGDVTSLSATINSYDAMNLLEYVDGDASGLEVSITAQDGRTITTHVSGDTSDLRAKINSLGNQTVYVNVVGRKLFAEGGRATEASVFGEAGPEWAIPEEHTEKTANLLNSAMTASGFTWAELASMYPGGSGNAGGNSAGSGMTLVYSPTIHAENVSGVSEELKLDKKRLDQWYAERQLRDRMEVYA